MHGAVSPASVTSPPCTPPPLFLAQALLEDVSAVAVGACGGGGHASWPRFEPDLSFFKADRDIRLRSASSRLLRAPSGADPFGVAVRSLCAAPLIPADGVKLILFRLFLEFFPSVVP